MFLLESCVVKLAWLGNKRIHWILYSSPKLEYRKIVYNSYSFRVVFTQSNTLLIFYGKLQKSRSRADYTTLYTLPGLNDTSCGCKHVYRFPVPLTDFLASYTRHFCLVRFLLSAHSLTSPHFVLRLVRESSSRAMESKREREFLFIQFFHPIFACEFCTRVSHSLLPFSRRVWETRKVVELRKEGEKRRKNAR